MPDDTTPAQPGGESPGWQRPVEPNRPAPSGPPAYVPASDPGQAPVRSGMRSVTLLLIGIVALAVIGGGAALAYKLLLNHEDRSTAAYAPRESIGYVAVNTDPTSRAWLDAWGLAKKAGIDDELAKLPKDGLEEAGESGATWDDLIKPAIGKEIGFAVWPSANADDTPGFAAIIMVADEDKANKTIDKIFEDETPTPVTYRDVSYKTDDDTAIGIVDGALIVTAGEDEFNAVIDAHLDGALDAEDGFKAAAERSADNPLVFTWIDGAAVADMVEGFSADANAELGLDQAFQTYRTLGNTTITAKADGNALRFVTLTEGRPENFPTKKAGDSFVGDFPASTLFYAASADLYNTVWKPMLTQLEDAAGMAGGVPTTDDLNGMFGFDVEAGLLAHLTGEYAVALHVDEDASGMYGYGGSFQFVSGVDDAATVQESINTLADSLESNGAPLTRTSSGFTIEEQGILAEVSVRDGTLRLTGKLGDTSGGGSLADDPSFKSAMQGMSKDASVVGYFALNRVIDLLPDEAWSDVPGDSRTALEALGPVSWASGPDGDGTRTDVVLVIE